MNTNTFSQAIAALQINMNALIAYLFKKCIIALIVNFKTTRNILQKTDLSIRISYTTIYYITFKYFRSIHGVFSVDEINYANKIYEFIKTKSKSMFQLILLRVVDFL